MSVARCLAFDVLGDHEQRPPDFATCSSSGIKSLSALILRSQSRINGVFEHGLHLLGIGDEVRRQEAAVELHALDDIEYGLRGLRIPRP